MTPELEKLISKLSEKDLNNLHKEIGDMLVDKFSETTVSYPYSQIRIELVKLNKVVPEWKHLTLPQRKRFIKAWDVATQSLKNRGFTDESAIQKIIIKVVSSNIATQTFLGLMLVLEKIEEAFASTFPGYSDAAYRIVELAIKGT